jgi:cell division protein FtsX
MMTHASRDFPAYRLTREALITRAIFVTVLVATALPEACFARLGLMRVVARSATSPARDAGRVASDSR